MDSLDIIQVSPTENPLQDELADSGSSFRRAKSVLTPA